MENKTYIDALNCYKGISKYPQLTSFLCGVLEEKTSIESIFSSQQYLADLVACENISIEYPDDLEQKFLEYSDEIIRSGSNILRCSVIVQTNMVFMAIINKQPIMADLDVFEAKTKLFESAMNSIATDLWDYLSKRDLLVV